MPCVCFLHVRAGERKEMETGKRIWLGKMKARIYGKFVKRRNMDALGIN